MQHLALILERINSAKQHFMSRLALLLLCTLTLLAGCATPPAPATATPVVTLSGAIRPPSPPIVREQEAATPTVPITSTETTGATPVGAEPLLPTPTATTDLPGVVLLPTPTPSAEVLPAADTGSLPANFQAQGAFTSTTTFADGTTQEQQGEFSITHVQAANVYGANVAYQLTTTNDSGATGTVTVYQIDDHIAVHFEDDEWIVLARDAESGLVEAIQPITDLARSFALVRAQAQDMGIEEVNGVAARHVRLDSPAQMPRLFAGSLFQFSGQITSLLFDVWITEPEETVLRYIFDVELSGASVLNRALQPEDADQHVIWTFELLETDGDLTLTWPEDAPAPGVLEVPGFAPGEFPIPPDAELVSTYVGLPELISDRSVDELSRFYQEELSALGWTLEGGFGLFLCSKDGDSFQLLIVGEEDGGSRVSILPAEQE